MNDKKFTIIFAILLGLFIVQHLLIKQPELFQRDEQKAEFDDVQFELLDGSIEPLGYYKDKQPLVLLFWTENCNPCRLALDDLGRRSDELREAADAEIITIASGMTAEEVQAIKAEWEIDLKIGLDPDLKIAEQLDITRFPTLIVIKKDGELSGRFDSYKPDHYDDIDYYLDRENNSEVIDTTEVIIETEEKSGQTESNPTE